MEKLFFYLTITVICLSISSCYYNPPDKDEIKKVVIDDLQEPHRNKIKNRTIISGVVREPSQKWVTILHKDLVTGRKSYTEPIDENGNFQFSIDLNYSQDVSLYYTNVSYIFCSAGDSLQLYFNGRRGIDSLTFKGANAKVNDQMHSFLDLIDFSSLAYLRNNKLDRKKFTDMADSYESEYLSMISTLNPEKEIAMWMDTYTRFYFARIRYNYGVENNIDHGDNFYNFFSRLDTLEMNVKISTEAYSVIQQYYDFQLENKGLTKSLQLAYDGDDYFSYASKNISFVSDYPSAINRLALASVIYPAIKLDYRSIDSLFSYYSEVVQNELLADIIEQRINYHQLNIADSESLTTLNSLSTNQLVGDLFTEIKEKNRDKVIYFDFWGTSCKYCIEEFPASVKLKKALEGKHIEFIYFCAPSEIKRQQKIIQRHNLEGQHYMLTRDQLKTLNSHFGFTALPRYMITDKQGTFIDSNAKKPSSKKILSQLAELADD